MPVKVLHIIYSLSVGGAQSVVLSYLRAFGNDKDFILRAVSLGKKTGSHNDIEIEQNAYAVKYLDLQAFDSNIPIIRPFVNWIRQMRLLNRAITEFKPDIIHTHLTPMLSFALLPTIISRVKIRFHTLHSDPYSISRRDAFFAKIAFKFCGFIPICITEEQAAKAMKRYGIRKYELLRNGLDFDKYNIEEKKEEIRRSLGFSDDIFLVGSVGRLDKVKNYPFLIDVFNEVYQQKPTAILVLIGEGQERENIEKEIHHLNLASAVKLLGSRNDVYRLYKAMDVFVLPSMHESSSIVTVEAQLAGIRCVVSDGIPKDVIVSDKVTRLSLGQSHWEWRNAILGDCQFCNKVNDMNEFSLKSCIKQLRKIYSEAYEGKHPDYGKNDPS